MGLIQELEAEAIGALKEGKEIPAFRAGVTVRVGVRVVEGTRTRVQNFEGVVIARSNRSINSNFTVRKISFGEGVERVFPLYSPNIDSITVVRRGIVRRAKLYYLRGRTGKRARIAERKNTGQSSPRSPPGGQISRGGSALAEPPLFYSRVSPKRGRTTREPVLPSTPLCPQCSNGMRKSKENERLTRECELASRSAG